MRGIAFAAALALLGPGVARGQSCDTALLLMIDTSASINAEEYVEQITGTADAIDHPEVIRSMTGGLYGATMVAVMQWGSTAEITVPWHMVRSDADAGALAGEIRSMRRFPTTYTYTGDAIASAIVAIDQAPSRCSRAVIDLSTDGHPNGGQMIPPLRTAIEMRGWTLNGLGIEKEAGDRTITDWLEEDVIAGIGAFARAATFETYRQAIRAKLIKEIAQR